jgi:hypothetical protein
MPSTTARGVTAGLCLTLLGGLVELGVRGGVDTCDKVGGGVVCGAVVCGGVVGGMAVGGAVVCGGVVGGMAVELPTARVDPCN